MSDARGFLQRWGTGPLAVYVCGMLLPIVMAVTRQELMIAMGVTVYTVFFWTGPFASAAAVAWSGWPISWRVAWVLLVPVVVAASLGLLFVFVTT